MGRPYNLKSTVRRSDFGRRLYEARDRKRLTQAQVAARLQISQGTLSELERSGDGSSLVVQFAQIYECDPVWLATGKGAAYPPAKQMSLQAHAIAMAFDAMPERTQAEMEAKNRLYWGFLQLMGNAPPANSQTPPLVEVPRHERTPTR